MKKNIISKLFSRFFENKKVNITLEVYDGDKHLNGYTVFLIPVFSDNIFEEQFATIKNGSVCFSVEAVSKKYMVKVLSEKVTLVSVREIFVDINETNNFIIDVSKPF